MGRKKHKGPREANGRLSRAKEPALALASRPEPADHLALDIKARHLMQQWGIGRNIEVEVVDPKTGELTKEIQLVPITRQAARNPLYGTFCGLLYQTKELSREQYDSGQRILDLRNLEMKRIGSESAIYERLGFQSGVLSQDELDKRQRAISAKWGELKHCIQEAQNQHRGNLWAALQYCLFEDQAFPHMIGDLRLALNVGTRFFGIGQRRKAA